MDQTILAPIPACDGLALELASKAIRANADYDLLVRTSASYVHWDAGNEAAIDRSLEEMNAACAALAAMPTTTLAGQRAKASVLLIMARMSSTCGSDTGDDTGLALSLLEDIIGRENLACGATLIDDILSIRGHGFGARTN